MKGSKASLWLNTVGPLVQPVNYVSYRLPQESKISETDFGAPKASQMSIADSKNSLRRVRQLPDAPQQLLLTRIRATDGRVAPERAIPPIFVAGAVFGERPQNRLAGWAYKRPAATASGPTRTRACPTRTTPPDAGGSAAAHTRAEGTGSSDLVPGSWYTVF